MFDKTVYHDAANIVRNTWASVRLLGQTMPYAKFVQLTAQTLAREVSDIVDRCALNVKLTDVWRAVSRTAETADCSESEVIRALYNVPKSVIQRVGDFLDMCTSSDRRWVAPDADLLEGVSGSDRHVFACFVMTALTLND